MTKFENFETCCPKQATETEIWKVKLEYEQSDVKKNVTQTLFTLNVLTQEIRLNVLFNLLERPHCICELVEKLKIGNSLVSYHISMLEKEKMIIKILQGGYTFLKITPKGKKHMKWIKTIPHDPDLIF